MNETLIAYAQNPVSLVSAQTMSQFSLFLPRILGSLLILIVGAAVARWLKRGLVNVLKSLKVSSLVEKTPVEHFLKNADLSQKIEDVVGSIVYWLLMLVVLNSAVAVLGLTSLSGVIEQVLAYIPNVVKAILVLFLGVLLAGLVESMIKGAIRSMDGKAARLLGKVSSYLVMTISVLIAISELGIASEYIMILFVGFVAAVSLGAGLALGLGGKEVVNLILTNWYQQTKKELESD